MVIAYEGADKEERSGVQPLTTNGGTDQTGADLNDNTDEQDTLHNDIMTAEIEHFGDKINLLKADDTLRLLLININSIPKADHPKNRAIFSALKLYQIDVAGFTECNRCWHLLNHRDRWKEITKPWWEKANNVIAYNVKDTSSRQFQPGGTLLHTINRPAHRVLETGIDPSGLGRWSWTRFRGKHDVTTRVICAYRPCKPSSAGPNTAYSQQLRFYDVQESSEYDVCPRDAILEDLTVAITHWQQEDKDQIILMMDCNQSILSEEIKDWASNIGLREIITEQHKGHSAPTYHRGTTPIDGIFTSASISTIASGYLPFGEFPSDHRALWIDIPYTCAFGFNIPRIITPAARDLKTDDIRVRMKWNAAYEQFLRQRKIHKTLFPLEEKIVNQNNSMTKEDEATYESIMNIRRAGIKYANKHCRKRYLGGVPYSQEYHSSCKEIELWKATKTIKLKAKYSSSKFRRLMKQTNIEKPLQYSMSEIIENEQRAMEKYWNLKKRSAEIRKTYLEDKAEQAAEEHNLTAAKMYGIMIQREAARSSFRKVRYVLGKMKGGSITKVDVIKDGSRVSLVSKIAIEEACMQENELKYRQTEQTPCMREPLRSLLGIGTTPSCDRILAGTFSPPLSTDKYTKEFLAELKYDDKATSLSPFISTATFINGWRGMKERTSAGISGLHFGHLKATTFNKYLSNTEASLSNIPFITGYSPQSWRTGILVMIQKKTLDDLLSSMRTLVLLEADANFNNKLLGKTTMEHAEQHDLLAKEQYGSRKGKCAIHHAVNKRLFYDIIRMNRRPAAICSNDAKSCFDRIVHSVAMLAYRRLGVDSPPVESMITSIQNLQHHVRTGFGDSYFTLSSSGTLIPFQGAIQGNGAAPTTWVVISTPLLNMMRRAGHGSHLITPISKVRSHSVGMAFVDDTDLTQTDMRDHTISTLEVMTEMQRAIDRWEGGLKATGGAIRPDKSWVFPISFKFNQMGQWEYCSLDDIDFTFSVKDCKEQRQTLPQFATDEALETLGVFLAPDGNNREQAKILRLKAEDWKEKIRVGHLDRSEAWRAIDYSILQSLRYPLPALTLTEKECKRIMAPVLEGGLPASAICRKFPRDILYGSPDEGGMGKTNLYIEQGLAKVEIFKEFIDSSNMLGEQLRVLTEQSKVELGLGGNLFTQEYARYGHLLTDSWIKSLWQFLSEFNITLEDNVTHTLPLQRENDLYLMEIICHSDKFTKAELRHINRSRLHLRATTLSDITTGYGTHYNQLAYNCIRDPTTPKHTLWPRQPRPGPTSIASWRKALRTCFPRNETGQMEYSLARWIRPVSPNWKWFYTPLSRKLYQRFGNTWRIWVRSSQRGSIGKFPSFKLFGNGIHLPPLSHHATVLFSASNKVLTLTGWSVTCPRPYPATQPNCRYSGWMTEHTNGTIFSQQEIATGFSTGSSRIVSDGSFEKTVQMGTAAWIIEDSSQIHRCTGKVSCPGDPSIQCSHRSELIGILGGILHVNSICETHHITSGHIRMGCDGEGAVRASNSSFEIIKSSRKHFDIIAAIHRAIEESPLVWNFFHIEGHQDDVFEYSELSRPAQLNCLADRLAKDKLTLDIQSPPTSPRLQHIPYELSTISWTDRYGQSVRISSQLKTTLRCYIGRETARRYWRKRGKFTFRTEKHIDWDTLHRAHKGLNPQLNNWLSKWLTGFCGIGATLFLYKFQRHTRCPRCNFHNETVEHVITCTDPASSALWTAEMGNLKTWMTENEFPPEMITVIYDSLMSWQSGSPYYTMPIDHSRVKEAMHEQDGIGWKNFMDGFQSKKWRTTLAEHLALLRSQRSELVLLAKLTKRLWLLSRMMWKHRNEVLHEANSSIHRHDLEKLNEAIEDEFRRGLRSLPRGEYSHLFSGSLRDRLQDTPSGKRMWITSVWTARDKFGDGYNRSRHPDVSIYFENWKKRVFIPPSDDEDDT